jgi:aquaporin Z
VPFESGGVGGPVGRRSLSNQGLTRDIIAQTLGAIAAAAALYVIATGKPGFDSGGFASNGYDALSLVKYSMIAPLVCEIAMTATFLFVIMGATDKRAPAGFAPIAIGLCLTLIHRISVPVTNASVNPAHSTGVALFAGGGYIAQLWLFWVAPIVGAAIGAVMYKAVAREE